MGRIQKKKSAAAKKKGIKTKAEGAASPSRNGSATAAQPARKSKAVTLKKPSAKWRKRKKIFQMLQTALDRFSTAQYLTPLLSQNFPVNGCRNPSAATGQISSSLNHAHGALACESAHYGSNALRMDARRLACGVGSFPSTFGVFVHLEEGEAR